MNPFNIREAGQTKNAADAAKLIGVSIPSTSGKPVRQENMKVQMNKFKSQSLQHQGSRSDARYCAIGNYDQSQSLQHQGSRSDTIYLGAESLRSQSLQHQGSRSDAC